MVDVPIFHVNGDDPEACVHVMRLAAEYRARFHSDVVVDLVCFRRYGHNEGDEPAFTQPKMYELVRAHPTVRSLYARRLTDEGVLEPDEAEELRRRCLAGFQKAHERVQEKSQLTEPSFAQGLWRTYRGGPEKDTPEPATGVPFARLSELLGKLASVPEGFEPHPKLVRLLDARRAMAEGRQPLDWATAELLALATLLADGYSVRLTGQDTERGTFSQRHAILHDVRTGAQHTALAHVSPVQGNVCVLNSPLSELGCLGFELGYSLDYPDALVAWEAQFGDFANAAQVIIDQFIAAAEDKWRRLSGLTLLLPHGYEGQGPEHSSARLERFLGLCAEDNMQVCYPTTPAQYFHLLRRQVVRPLRKPLVVMTPKSMLRKPEATSPLSALARGRFERVLFEQMSSPERLTRLLLCSGKVYYELAAAKEQKKDDTIGVVRLEQLYPFPHDELAALLRRTPHLAELFWVQEEPKNTGAWRYTLQPVQHLLAELGLCVRYGYVGRVESASPATGFYDAHVYEQKLLVEEALARGHHVR
ncbi:MAG: thiamine pyrophosphate-dependent enzyme, partial [Myxococcota bacterium]